MNTFNPESDVIAWIGLRRVHDSGVASVAGCWVDGGRRVPSYLPAALDELTDAGLIVLADDGPHGPLRRASLTEAGQARYGALSERYDATLIARAEVDVPGPEFEPSSTALPPLAAPTGLHLPSTTTETRLAAG